MVSMDNIMSAKLGELSTETDTLKINFKKTINIRQYESEVSEVEITLKVPNNISSAERMLMLGVMQAQAEYEMYCMLVFKEQITKQEFERRRQELEKAVNTLKVKAESITGKSMDYCINSDK